MLVLIFECHHLSRIIVTYYFKLPTPQEQIRNEKLKAITELKNEVANLSIEMAEKILKSELSDKKAQSEMIERTLKQKDLN